MSKDIRGSQMSMRYHYLTRAAELQARARMESNEMDRREYENLARQFLRLAEQTDRNYPTYQPSPKLRRQS